MNKQTSGLADNGPASGWTWSYSKNCSTFMDKPGTRKEKVNSMKIGNLVHEKVLLLPDSNAEPVNHKTDALSTDPARKHI